MCEVLVPSLTAVVGCNRPALRCCVARLNPELSHCSALTRSMTCSARLLVAALLDWSTLPRAAPRGVARLRATSHTQSQNATTKFNLARISLCSRSRRVSSVSSGAMKVNLRSSNNPALNSGKRSWKLPASANVDWSLLKLKLTEFGVGFSLYRFLLQLCTGRHIVQHFC